MCEVIDINKPMVCVSILSYLSSLVLFWHKCWLNINFNDTVVFIVKRDGYIVHFLYVSKDEPINLRNTDMTEKSEIF